MTAGLDQVVIVVWTSRPWPVFTQSSLQMAISRNLHDLIGDQTDIEGDSTVQSNSPKTVAAAVEHSVVSQSDLDTVSIRFPDAGRDCLTGLCSAVSPFWIQVSLSEW